MREATGVIPQMWPLGLYGYSNSCRSPVEIGTKGPMPNTKVRLARAVCAVAIAYTALAAPAVAGTLDQSQPEFDSWAGFGITDRGLAQTFVAGIGGQIDRVAIPLWKKRAEWTGPLPVQIRPATETLFATGPRGPTSEILASTTLHGGDFPTHTDELIPVDFPSPATVRKGQLYAIVLIDPLFAGPWSNWYVSGVDTTAGEVDRYANGALEARSIYQSDYWSPWSDWIDAGFSTYVVPDATAPELSVTHVANANGWNDGEVTVTIGASDSVTGLVGDVECTDNGNPLRVEGTESSLSTSVTTDGVHEVACTARDGNDNVARTVDTVRIDTVPPKVSVASPAAGSVYVAGPNEFPGTACTTTDPSGSGVAQEARPEPTISATTGAAVAEQLGFGEHTLTCFGATDLAGNSGNSASVGFRLTFPWRGFFQPVDYLDATGNYLLNLAKSGATIPVRFSLGGYRGLDIFAAGSPSTAVLDSCDTDFVTDELEQYAAASQAGLHYDAHSEEYVYNWKTSDDFVYSCRRLIFRFVDGTMREARFVFRK